MGLFGGDSSAISPSKVTDNRAVGYGSAPVVTGSKNRVTNANASDSAYQFKDAVSLSGDGNSSVFSVLDGGAIAASFEFAKAALAASDKQIAGFAEQAGQVWGKTLESGMAEASPEAAGLSKLRLLIWPAVALLAFWIWSRK